MGLEITQATAHVDGKHILPRPLVRVVTSHRLLAQMRRDRVRTYAALGVKLNDRVLDTMRRCGTNLGVFVDRDLVGGFAAWRMSEGMIGLGYAVKAFRLDALPPDRVIEIGAMYILPQHQHHGFAGLLKEAGRILIGGMRPQVIVAFAVDAVRDLYVDSFGFRVAGPSLMHPLAPTVRVHPLAVTYRQFARRNFA